MSVDPASGAGQADVRVVEERLAALWQELSPAQQALLDAIIGAGLAVAGGAETAGYLGPLASPEAMDEYVRTRSATLRDGQHAGSRSSGSTEDGRRWDLAPLVDWLRRATGVESGLRPQGGLMP